MGIRKGEGEKYLGSLKPLSLSRTSEQDRKFILDRKIASHLSGPKENVELFASHTVRGIYVEWPVFGFTGDFSELSNFVPDSSMESTVLGTSPLATTKYQTNIANEKKGLFWLTV